MFVLVCHIYDAAKTQPDDTEVRLVTSQGSFIKLKHIKCYNGKLL
jgi:hypothetical protein